MSLKSYFDINSAINSLSFRNPCMFVRTRLELLY
nr:MAG TPA: hypothetical protein [Caudoviricetes sp.]